MMMSTRCVCVLLMLALANTANAVDKVMEPGEVISFVKKMYSYSANTFEAGEFQQKYSSEKHCVLLKEFFTDELLKLGKSSGRRCDLGSFVRYPGLGSDEFDMYGESGAIPKPKLKKPKVESDRGSISVSTEFGRTIFFLIKTEKGLRVENALYYERVPSEANVCHGQFLKEPTPAQLKLRPECKDY